METAYLFAGGLGGLIWLGCFLGRPGLRFEQMTMSLIGIPLALSDIFYVPNYWRPRTLGHVPVGVEGVLFSFEAAGICAVIYAVVFGMEIVYPSKGGDQPAPRKLLSRLRPRRILIALIPLPVSAVIAAGLNTNLEWGLYAGLIATTLVMISIRRDLARPALGGAIAFLPLYTGSLILWVAAYPRVHDWFTLWRMPHWYLLAVPVTEIAFGALFAAYWTCVYPMVFDAAFAPRRQGSLNGRDFGR